MPNKYMIPFAIDDPFCREKQLTLKFCHHILFLSLVDVALNWNALISKFSKLKEENNLMMSKSDRFGLF